MSDTAKLLNEISEEFSKFRGRNDERLSDLTDSA
jgi:hypothetical protein